MFRKKHLQGFFFFFYFRVIIVQETLKYIWIHTAIQKSCLKLATRKVVDVNINRIYRKEIINKV